MKRNGIRFILALAFMVFFNLPAEAQLFKKNRPPKPEPIEETIPQPPSSFHVWESGSWKWSKKQQEYKWREGYWRIPHPSEYNRFNGGFYGFSPYGFYSPYAFGFGRRIFLRNPYFFYW